MPRRSVPKYQHHKATGQARVRIGGKDHWLGIYGTPESHGRYAALLADWQAKQTDVPKDLTVAQLTVLYLTHCRQHYQKNGAETSEVATIRQACKRLNEKYRHTLAAKFGPLNLKTFRQSLIDANLCRTNINGTVARVRRLFRWAVSEEFVPGTVLVELKSVADLQRGRCKARESLPVKPVAEADINAVLPHVSRQVRDMIRLQLLSGCRPDEIVTVRPCDVNRDGDVWEYTPASHKTEHHGRERRIYFGPRSQAILGPWLENRPAESPCFSAAEAEAERREKQRAARQTPVQPSQVKRAELRRTRKDKKRTARAAYDVASYRAAIQRGCDVAGIDHWSPNQLRHSRATDLRRTFGLEAAKTVCGHSKLETTLIYAETDFARARAIMAEVG